MKLLQDSHLGGGVLPHAPHIMYTEFQILLACTRALKMGWIHRQTLVFKYKDCVC